jgi:integrase
MTVLIEAIKKQRPNIADSTVKTYASTLSALHKKVFGSEIALKNFENTKKVMEHLQDKPPSTRKTVLSALYILTGLEDYQNQMKQDIQSYKQDVSKQEMSDKQKAAFKSQEEILGKLNDLKIAADLLYKKSNLTASERNEIQNYIILALTSGVYIPPRRSLDWVHMKISNIDKEKDNYIDKQSFIFNRYKGSEKKDTQVITIPKPLQQILKKWLKVNNSEYLLTDTQGKPLTSIKMTQRLNRILGANSSINTLRHSYLSSKYQDTIKKNEDLAKDMEAMGSSTNQSKIYIQKIE